MKHALLVFGILLVIAGAASIYSGYDIIEIERGWASVIAGTTALTGGAITIGLAWILRSLEELRATVETREMRPAPAGTQALQPETPAALPVALATASVRENAPVQQREEPVFGQFDRTDTEMEEIAEQRFEPPTAPPASPPKMPETSQPAAQKPSLSRASYAFTAAAAKARTERRSEPSVSELWRRVGVNLEAAKSEPPAEAPEAPLPRSASLPPTRQSDPAAAEPEAGDWLDQAMARFDEAIPPESGETSEEAPPLAPRSSPEQPESPEPEVIGRYEAEGTAYVMYADGSIDAQSEQGILRFHSLAELKAFFQS
jgi:hypothetical protein